MVQESSPQRHSMPDQHSAMQEVLATPLKESASQEEGGSHGGAAQSWANCEYCQPSVVRGLSRLNNPLVELNSITYLVTPTRREVALFGSV